MNIFKFQECFLNLEKSEVYMCLAQLLGPLCVVVVLKGYRHFLLINRSTIYRKGKTLEKQIKH